MSRLGKKRYINTRFWEDVYISNLDPIEKLLFLYFITNPHTNIGGIYEIPLKTIAVDTGIDKEMVEKVIRRFSADNKVFYIKGWVCVVNFSKHQGDSPSIKQGIEKAFKDAPPEIMLILQGNHTQSPHSVHTVPPQPDLSESISESISESKSISISKSLKNAEPDDSASEPIKENKPETPFSWDQYLEGMYQDKKRAIQIIAAFFDVRGISFSSAKQVQVGIRRHLRAAQQLANFETDVVAQAMDKAQKKHGDIDWTLETLIKLITK